MAASRPVVNVYSSEDDSKVATAKLPAVFTAPIRPDVVGFVHTNMNKNKRQAYAVNVGAGHQCSAESWGTGRAVSRIPRVQGGGTSRAGQGAFGNMCRGGRMFGPTKTWRKWHKKINQNQRRYAVASAIAATALPALVMARGHKISRVSEIPLVISDAIEKTEKTKDAVKLLAKFGAGEDVQKAVNSKKLRRGKGKMRNRRWTMRRGPLIVYNKAEGIEKAFRNIPGVDVAQVDRLNLLQLAPGGHMGRFVIWTQGAFAKLDSLYGTYKQNSALKSGFHLPAHLITNADIARVINSDEIQSIVKPAQRKSRYVMRKKNPLKNFGVMMKLNPYAATMRRAEILGQEAAAVKKAAAKDAKRKGTGRSEDERATKRARKAAGKAFLAACMTA